MSLPLLWWKLTNNGPELYGGGFFADITLRAPEGVPEWFGSLRAATILAAFVGMLLGVIGLILGHSRRLGAIGAVLCAAGLLGASPGLAVALGVAVLALMIALLALGVG